MNRATTMTGRRNIRVRPQKRVLFAAIPWGIVTESTLKAPVGIVRTDYSDSLVREWFSADVTGPPSCGRCPNKAFHARSEAHEPHMSRRVGA